MTKTRNLKKIMELDQPLLFNIEEIKSETLESSEISKIASFMSFKNLTKKSALDIDSIDLDSIGDFQDVKISSQQNIYTNKVRFFTQNNL